MPTLDPERPNPDQDDFSPRQTENTDGERATRRQNPNMDESEEKKSTRRNGRDGTDRSRGEEMIREVQGSRGEAKERSYDAFSFMFFFFGTNHSVY